MEREQVFRKLREILGIIQGEIFQMKHQEKNHGEAYDTFIYSLKNILSDSDLEDVLRSINEKKDTYDLTFLKEMENKCEKDLDDYLSVANSTIEGFVFPDTAFPRSHDYMDLLIKKFHPKFREDFIKDKMKDRIDLFVKNIP